MFFFPAIVPSNFCDPSILFNSHRFPAMAGLCLDLSTNPGLSEVKTVEFHFFPSFQQVRISNERNDAPLMFEIAGNLQNFMQLFQTSRQQMTWVSFLKVSCFQPILRQPPKPTHGSGQFHDFAPRLCERTLPTSRPLIRHDKLGSKGGSIPLTKRNCRCYVYIYICYHDHPAIYHQSTMLIHVNPYKAIFISMTYSTSHVFPSPTTL